MKTAEELDALTRELEALNKKLAELTEEELKQVAGGDAHLPNQQRRNPSLLGNTGGIRPV